jgi:hypothetical protein
MEPTSPQSERADTRPGNATQQWTSSDSTPSTTPQRANFLALPPELRLLVYDHVYTRAIEANEERWCDPIFDLICTSDQIYAETKKHFITKLTQSTREYKDTVAELEERARAFTSRIASVVTRLTNALTIHFSIRRIGKMRAKLISG